MTEKEPQKTGSVTDDLQKIKAGETGTAQDQLYQRYYQAVLNQARMHIRGMKVLDESDVAINVWDTVFRNLREGEMNTCANREDFERLLAIITYRKAVNLYNWMTRRRRHPARRLELTEALTHEEMDESQRRVAELYYIDQHNHQKIAEELNIDVAEVDERLTQIRRWLYQKAYQPLKIASFPSAGVARGDQPFERMLLEEELISLSVELQETVLLILQGCTVDQIANELDVSTRTVQRRLALVRKQLEAQLEEGAD